MERFIYRLFCFDEKNAGGQIYRNDINYIQATMQDRQYAADPAF
ncbi:MAG: hypothetical protein RRZ24_01775 [Clostridia bacterium]